MLVLRRRQRRGDDRRREVRGAGYRRMRTRLMRARQPRAEDVSAARRRLRIVRRDLRRRSDGAARAAACGRGAVSSSAPGHCARALARLAQDCGWHVTVLDDRAELLARFSRAAADHAAAAPEFIASRTWQRDEALVLVSRNYELDREALDAALRAGGMGYLGMIGSRRKVRRVFDELTRSRGERRSAGAGLCAHRAGCRRGFAGGDRGERDGGDAGGDAGEDRSAAARIVAADVRRLSLSSGRRNLEPPHVGCYERGLSFAPGA